MLSLDCGAKEKPLSASNDRSIRLWKVAEETHLVFRGHKGSIDCVQYLTDTTFVSGGQDGSLNLWKDAQKSPVKSIAAAHGYQMQGGKATCNPNWISSLTCIKMSNVVATGSCDGFVRLWAANAEERLLAPLCEFPVAGFVNALVLTEHMLIVGTGKEHRFGRWWNLKGNLNKVICISFNAKKSTDIEIAKDDI